MEGFVPAIHEDGNKRYMEIMVDGLVRVNYFPKDDILEFSDMREVDIPPDVYTFRGYRGFIWVHRRLSRMSPT